MTFRFDDICINTYMPLVDQMTDYLFYNFPGCQVIYGISPLVHKMHSQQSVHVVTMQRVFPEILNAMSDYRNFFKVELAGVPVIKNKRVIRAGHGLIHVDHRLLSKEAQELSIVTSCSLVSDVSTLGERWFIPPFNKWNSDTEDICDEWRIELIKFEDGWLSMEYNTYTSSHEKWYLHSREWTFEKFVAWFQ